MVKRRRFPKIFFGWWTVLTSGILCLWLGGYFLYGFSALFKPIASELGFSRAVISVAASIGRFEGGVEAPLTGWITDRFGPRWIITFGVFLVGLGLILMNFIDSLWAFYVVWGVIVGTGHNISATLPTETAIANWFVKNRGRALSIKWVLSGLSGVIVLPLVAWLITIQSWRMTCLIGGVVMWLVGLPLASFCFKRHRPEHKDHVWSYDFMVERTTDGRAFRISNIIDEFTRECPAILMASKVTTRDVIDQLFCYQTRL